MSINTPQSRLESGSGQTWINRGLWIGGGILAVAFGTHLLIHELLHHHVSHAAIGHALAA
jgi:hypothetical protein